MAGTATPTKTPTKKASKKAAPTIAAAPRGSDRGQIQVRLPQDLIDRLDIEAERRSVSKTFLVEKMVATSLPRWEEQDISAI